MDVPGRTRWRFAARPMLGVPSNRSEVAHVVERTHSVLCDTNQADCQPFGQSNAKSIIGVALARSSDAAGRIHVRADVPPQRSLQPDRKYGAFPMFVGLRENA